MNSNKKVIRRLGAGDPRHQEFRIKVRANEDCTLAVTRFMKYSGFVLYVREDRWGYWRAEFHGRGYELWVSTCTLVGNICVFTLNGNLTQALTGQPA